MCPHLVLFRPKYSHRVSGHVELVQQRVSPGQQLVGHIDSEEAWDNKIAVVLVLAQVRPKSASCIDSGGIVQCDGQTHSGELSLSQVKWLII